MGASIQIGAETLIAIRPLVAWHIDAGQPEQIEELLTQTGIPPELQPEAVRQLAVDCAANMTPRWTYDPARVESVADQLVRRTPEQHKARQELLERFNLLNEGRTAEAFDTEALRPLLPRLATEDQRRAVRLMATVAAESSDNDLRAHALKALGQNAAYLKPSDAAGITASLLELLAKEPSLHETIARIVADGIAPFLEGDERRKALDAVAPPVLHEAAGGTEDSAVDPDEAFADPTTGFVYNGVNETAVFRSLTVLNGIPIARIEEMMRPGTGFVHRFERSRQGFLGQKECLLEVMAEDNDWVLSQGLSHQEIGRVLRDANEAAFDSPRINLRAWCEQRMRDDAAFRDKWSNSIPRYAKCAHAMLCAYCDANGLNELYEQHLRKYRKVAEVIVIHEFELRGCRFIGIPIGVLGAQPSPFRDGLAGERNPIIANRHSKKSLRSNDLLGHLIYRYGFYEGHGTPWRVSPQEIVEVFDFLKR